MTNQRKQAAFGCLIAFPVFVVLLAAGLVLTYTFWQRRAGAEAEAILARLRDANQPTTLAELDGYYGLDPSATDVTEKWLRALAPLASSRFSAESAAIPIVGTSEEVPPLGEHWIGLPAARQFLDQYSSSLRLLHEAADEGPSARFAVAFEDGFKMLLPHAQELRGGARMLELEVQVRAHEGDYAGAVDSLRAGLRLSRALEREPIIVSQLVRIATFSLAAQRIPAMLPRLDVPDQTLASLQLTLREGDFRDGLRRGLVGERTVGAYAFRDLPAAAEMENLNWLPVNNEDTVLYLELMGSLVDATNEKRWSDFRRRFDFVEQTIQRRFSGVAGKIRYIRSTLLMPALTSVADAAVRAEALRHIADTAVAVERYRRAEGTPPVLLADLVPRFLPVDPVDPFDDLPLRYRILQDGAVVYSVGMDGRDDQGAIGDRPEQPLDIAAELRWLEKP